MENTVGAIPVSIELRANASLESGKRNFAVLLQRSPWLKTLEKEALALAKENASARSKYRRLVRLVDRVSDAIAPSAACARGCSHCCHRSVGVSAHEAELISEFTGRPIRNMERTAVPMTVAEDAPREPCPFLRDNACSIYEHRPVACRINFNISDDAFFCDPSTAPEGSQPPQMRLDALLMAYAMVFLKQPLADIRSFFSPLDSTT